MESFLTRRLCKVCLGRFLSCRQLSFQATNASRGNISWRLKNSNIQNNFIPKRTNTQNGNKGNPQEKSTIPWAAVVIASSMGLGYAVIRYQKSRAEKELLKSQPVPMVTLSVGGDWELVNQDGKVMTNKDFLGQWLLLYFGFTHCPDICPDELEKIVKAVNIVDANKDIPNIKPLFITIDEDRDTSEVIKTYLADFSPKLIGFTGTKEQVGSIKKAYRVYSSKGPVNEDNDYIVDHSIITYLVNPDGDTVMYFSREKDMMEIARSIEKAMMLYQRLAKG